MSNPVPSDKISDGKENFKTIDEFVNGSAPSVTTRAGKVIRTLEGINAEFDEVQAGQFVAASQDAADRAETAAEVAAAAGRVYETSAAGQADSELVDGDYFWVVSAEDSEVLELWRKGASSATNTGKRTISEAAVARRLEVSKIGAGAAGTSEFKANVIDLTARDILTDAATSSLQFTLSDGVVAMDSISGTSGIIDFDVGKEVSRHGRYRVEMLVEIVTHNPNALLGFGVRFGAVGTEFCIGVLNSTISGNGAIIVWKDNAAFDALGGDARLAYNEGDMCRMIIETDRDNHADVTLYKNGEFFYTTRLNIPTGFEDGKLSPAVSRAASGSQLKYHYFKVDQLPASEKTYSELLNQQLFNNGKFVAGEILNARLFVNGLPTPSGTYKIEDGAFHLIEDEPLSIDAIYFETPRRLNREKTQSIKMRWSCDELADTTGPCIWLGGGLAVVWTHNGVVGPMNLNGGSNLDFGGWVSGAITINESDYVEFAVTISPDGEVALSCRNLTTEQDFTHQFGGVGKEFDKAYIALRKGSNFVCDYFIIEDVYEADISHVEEEISALAVRVQALENQGGQGSATFDEPLMGIKPPPGFTWDYPFTVQRGISTGRFTCDINPSDYVKPTNNTFYLDKETGSDSNNGSESSPFATLAHALSQGNSTGQPYTIIASAGEYNYQETGELPQATQNHNIICFDESPAIFTTASTESGWTQHPSIANVWEKTITGPAPLWAYDNANKDEYGEGRALVTTALESAMQNPGRCRIDGQKIQVHLLDSRMPDGDVRVLRDIALFRAGNTGWYHQNIHFLGGRTVTFDVTNGSSDGFFNRCRLSYAYQGNVLNTRRNRPATIFVVRSVASYSRILDGWNYHHSSSGLICHNVLELDTMGHHNGLENANNNNGSTMHDGGYIVRISGDYSYNNDRNIHDISDGTEVWMLGCTAGDAQNSRTDPYDNANFLFGRRGASDNTKAWLDSCISRGGSVGDFGVYNNSELRVKNTDVSAANFKVVDSDGTGLLEGY